MGLLIDSTVLIHAERARQTRADLVRALLDRFGDVELALSVMTAGELFHGCWLAETALRRAQREEFAAATLAAIPTVPVTLTVMRVFGQLDAQMRAQGKSYRPRIF